MTTPAPTPAPHPELARARVDVNPPPQPTLADLVARRISLKADAEYIAGEIAALDAQLLDLLDTGIHDVDGTKVQVREYSRLSYPSIERDFPAEQYPDLYITKTSIDQAAVKKQFAPAALDDYKVRGARSVVI